MFAKQGAVFAVAVDRRRSSHSFGRWAGVDLSADNRRALWLPEGFAYGFLVLSEQARVVHLYTEFLYNRHDRVLAWDDPELAIRWPHIGPIAPPFAGTPLRSAETFE